MVCTVYSYGSQPIPLSAYYAVDVNMDNSKMVPQRDLHHMDQFSDGKINGDQSVRKTSKLHISSYELFDIADKARALTCSQC